MAGFSNGGIMYTLAKYPNGTYRLGTGYKKVLKWDNGGKAFTAISSTIGLALFGLALIYPPKGIIVPIVLWACLSAIAGAVVAGRGKKFIPYWSAKWDDTVQDNITLHMTWEVINHPFLKNFMTADALKEIVFNELKAHKVNAVSNDQIKEFRDKLGALFIECERARRNVTVGGRQHDTSMLDSALEVARQTNQEIKDVV